MNDSAIVNSVMPKKPEKLRPDVAEVAFRVMLEATGEAPKTLPPNERTEKNTDAQERGRVGGKRGASARAERLTPERRREIGRNAAAKRWNPRPDTRPDDDSK